MKGTSPEKTTFTAVYTPGRADENILRSPHYHHYYEMYCFLGDEMTYFLGNGNMQLHYGDIVLVDKLVFHQCFYPEAEGANRARINLSFSAGDIAALGDEHMQRKILALFTQRCYRAADERVREQLCAMFCRCCTLYEQEADRLHARVILWDLLLSLMHLEQAGGFEKDGEPISGYDKRLSEMITYINEHYGEPITLSSLSTQFFFNKYYLSHLFRQATGLNVTAFINEKRLTEAGLLLKNSALSITEISARCGFNNMSHFIALFKRLYGTTPSQYRELRK